MFQDVESVLIMIYSGLRPGEIIKIKNCRYRLEKNELWSEASKPKLAKIGLFRLTKRKYLW